MIGITANGLMYACCNTHDIAMTGTLLKQSRTELDIDAES